jgi:hypothetical protein
VKAYTEQAKYVARFDRMMKEEKIKKVGIIRPEEKREIEQAVARPVEVPQQQPDDDFSEFMDVDRYKQKGRIAL